MRNELEMSMVCNNYSTAILCGGRSRRMGEDKAALKWKGTPLAARKWKQFAEGSDGEVFFSVRDEVQGSEIRKLVSDAVQTVPDLMPDCGPLCGILSSLIRCREEILFATAVDMPFSDRVIAGELTDILEKAGPDTDAVVPVSADGRQHPLCAAYRKSCVPVFRGQLEMGNYKVRDALGKLSVRFVQTSSLTDAGNKTANINDREGYRKILQACVPVYSVIAWSDTGKTTYLERLIPALKEEGVRAAVIKHDGHEFDIDHEGTDSAKFTAAGADISGIFSDSHAALMLNYPIRAEDLISLVAMSGSVDLILTEGCKKGKWPKILLYRESSAKPMAADPESCAAVVSDVQMDAAVPVFDIQDVKAMAKFLKSKC